MIHTTVTAALLRRRLLLGSGIAAAGVAILIGANFLSSRLLNGWGLLLSLLSILLIALGLIPYRRLTRLQLHPNHIALEEEHLVYLLRNSPRFRLYKEAIQELTFHRRGDEYGIGLQLFAQTAKKIAVVDPSFNMQAFIDRSRRRGFDLYLPLFSQRAAQELREWHTSSERYGR
jgi:uncharacterized protein (DUF58 family)